MIVEARSDLRDLHRPGWTGEITSWVPAPRRCSRTRRRRSNLGARRAHLHRPTTWPPTCRAGAAARLRAGHSVAAERWHRRRRRHAVPWLDRAHGACCGDRAGAVARLLSKILHDPHGGEAGARRPGGAERRPRVPGGGAHPRAGRCQPAAPRRSQNANATEADAAPGPEDGGGRPADRRHRARLQQPADRDPRQPRLLRRRSPTSGRPRRLLDSGARRRRSGRRR